MPVVLLHGVTDSWRSFEPVLPHLPASLRAFALSQRGHGDSERPATNYHPRDFAADVAAFMDALNLERAVIVGHSMGSYVAQQFAINYPERTLGLVLIGSFVKCHDKPDLVEYCDTAVNSLTDPVPVDFAREFQESTLARPVPPEFLAMVIEESLKVPARVWQAAFRGLLEADHSGELDKIQAPTLILWGDKDSYFPESDQHTLASRIRRLAPSRLSRHRPRAALGRVGPLRHRPRGLCQKPTQPESMTPEHKLNFAETKFLIRSFSSSTVKRASPCDISLRNSRRTYITLRQ